jgi:transcriptional regulator with XRE-family HTH domain
MSGGPPRVPGGRRAVLHSVPDADPGDQLRVQLGPRLRTARREAGLTQEQAAQKAGLTRNAIASLERSTFPDPRLSTLLRLMRTYGLGSIEELLGPTPSERLATAWRARGWQVARDAQRG